MRLTSLLILSSLLFLVSAVPLPIIKSSPKWIPAEDAQLFKRSINPKTLAGSTISMGGGLLTMGAYFANISIGTPPQVFSVLIDTGSSNLVVGAVGCETCGSKLFNPVPSSSYHPTSCRSKECAICTPDGGTDRCVFGAPYCLANTENCGFGISYGGGSSLLQGFWATDSVCFGSLCTTATFGMSTAQYPPNNLDPFDGILGLASPFNACNPTCVTTVLDSYVEKQLTGNLYSMCLTNSQGGILDLGEIVASRYTGEIQYATQEVDRWFNLVLYDIKVGDISLGLPPFAYATTNDVIGAFVDSGTSILLFSPLIFAQLQSVFQLNCKLPGICGNDTFFSGECFPESQIQPVLSSYPPINFIVESTKGGNLTLSVPASSYLMLAQGQYCSGMAAVSGVGVVLGDVFMENYYIVFDREHSQIGFAPLASCTL